MTLKHRFAALAGLLLLTALFAACDLAGSDKGGDKNPAPTDTSDYADTAIVDATWSSYPYLTFRGQDGRRVAYHCPPGGFAGTVWGTEVYTDDSSVCTAGVHTGTISLDSGGIVRIEIRPGESTYTGTTRNGITTLSYPSWDGSFVVL